MTLKKIMIRILIVLILIMMGSCKKDEIIPIKVSMPPKVTEIKKEGKVPPKKRKFRFFKRKKYRGSKSCSRTF
jgi:hypothetical protein